MRPLNGVLTCLLFAASIARIAAAAPQKASLDLTALTGHVQIQTSYELRGLTAGLILPVAVQPGSEVTVLSGHAVFKSGETTIRAAEGDSFTYSLIQEEGGAGGIRVAATGRSTALVMSVGEATAVLNEGNAVAVVPSIHGGQEIQSLAGYLTWSSSKGDHILAPGQIARVEPPGAPSAPPMAVAETAPGTENDLRSAVGKKRTGSLEAGPPAKGSKNSLGAVTPMKPVQSQSPPVPPLRLPGFVPENYPACFAIDPRVGPQPESVCGPAGY